MYGKHAPVGGVGAAVADRDHRDLVGGRLVDHRVGDAGRQHVEHRGAGRPLVLEPLVALDAAGVVVLGLALLVGELDAVHAAVARVDHVHVVDEPAVDAGAAGRVRPDPVAGHRDELLLRVGRAGQTEHRDAHERRFHCFHVALLLGFRPQTGRAPNRIRRPGFRVDVRRRTSMLQCVNAGTATAAASPWQSATSARVRAARRSGRG